MWHLRTRPQAGSWWGLVLARLGVLTGGIVAVSIVVFALMEAAPGDAATQFLGANATPERLAGLREELGLERPVWMRYLDWAGGIVTGDPGRSLASRQPVWDLVVAPARRTAALAGVAFLGTLVIGVGGGIASGVRATGRTDRVLSTVALGGLSLPEFVIGIALISVFGLWLKVLPAVSLLPVSGQVLDKPQILVLPAATLAVVSGSYVMRLVRGIVAAASIRPDVEAARLDGVGPGRLLFVHLLPSVAGPMVTSVVVTVPYLIGGAVVVEQLFGYPGLGRLLVTAVDGRDQPVVMAIVMLLSTIALAGYAVADLAGRLLDPHRSRPA